MTLKPWQILLMGFFFALLCALVRDYVPLGERVDQVLAVASVASPAIAMFAALMSSL